MPEPIFAGTLPGMFLSLGESPVGPVLAFSVEDRFGDFGGALAVPMPRRDWDRLAPEARRTIANALLRRVEITVEVRIVEGDEASPEVDP